MFAKFDLAADVFTVCEHKFVRVLRKLSVVNRFERNDM